MRIAVVVPNRDGRRWLPGLLASLRAQTRPADRVVVVDDGSTDDSVAWLRGQDGVEVVERAARPARVRRRGQRRAGRGRRLPRGRAAEHRRRAGPRLARADRRGVGSRTRGRRPWRARWCGWTIPRSSTTPATRCGATASASSAGAAGPTARGSRRPARCGAPARARRCTGARRWSASAAWTSPTACTSRTSTSRCGCAWRGGRAATSRPSPGTPAAARAPRSASGWRATRSC